MPDCRKMLGDISAYIDGDLDPAICRELEKHLAGCDNCRVMVNTLTRTIDIVKGNATIKLPASFKKRLHDELARKWKSDRSA